MRSPILAAILSLILSGLGQIYNGQITKGVIFIVIQLINAALDDSYRLDPHADSGSLDSSLSVRNTPFMA